jgi:hypothetical protein
VGSGFSENFRQWLDEQIAAQGLTAPEPHHDG